MAGLGSLLAALLAVANRRLYVYEDPRIDVVEDMLPHANCGACGTPGCRPNLRWPGAPPGRSRSIRVRYSDPRRGWWDMGKTPVGINPNFLRSATIIFPTLTGGAKVLKSIGTMANVGCGGPWKFAAGPSLPTTQEISQDGADNIIQFELDGVEHELARARTQAGEQGDDLGRAGGNDLLHG